MGFVEYGGGGVQDRKVIMLRGVDRPHCRSKNVFALFLFSWSIPEYNKVRCLLSKQGYISPMHQYPSDVPNSTNLIRMKPLPMSIYRIWR